jgi:hypothetical protein
MNTEQFRWIDDNYENDQLEFCSVYIVVEDRIDIATQSNPTTIGVVVGSLDLDQSWATVQISGRVEVYRTNYKPKRWILLRENVKTGPYGPVDEYFIGH